MDKNTKTRRQGAIPGTDWGIRRPKITRAIIRHAQDAHRLGAKRGDLMRQFHLSGSTIWWVINGLPAHTGPETLRDPARISTDALRAVYKLLATDEGQVLRDAIDAQDGALELHISRVLDYLRNEVGAALDVRES